MGRRDRRGFAATDGSGELPVANELFSGTEVLGRTAMERMMAGLSTRRYFVGLEPVGTRTERAATSTSRSAVSRRFVAATETALVELLAADLSKLDLVGLMIDGVHFSEHCCVVALGIGIDGTKHPLSLVEGSTENATLVTELIVWAASARSGRHPPHPGRAGWVPRRCAARCSMCSTAGARPSSTAQDPQRGRQAAGEDAPGRGLPDAAGLPRGLRAGRR